MSRPFKSAVKDRPAFEASLAQVLTLDFDRIIVGHGDVISANGRTVLRDAMRAAGFDLPK